MFYIKKKYLLIFIFTLISISAIFVYIINGKSISANTTPSGYIAIVIDDLGDYADDGLEELMKLDIPITTAVMPFLENTKNHTDKATKAGFEVIIHLSMESENGYIGWLGPRPIKHNSTEEQIKSIMYDAIHDVDGAKGINNHMGSRVMKDKTIIEEILSISKETNLYFLDSRTVESSVAEEVSRELGVVYFYRDVFLDNSKDLRSIEEALNKLTNIALKKGYAIGIGHIGGHGGKSTINTINKMSKSMQEKGIKFIYLSELLDISNNHK